MTAENPEINQLERGLLESAPENNSPKPSNTIKELLFLPWYFTRKEIRSNRAYETAQGEKPTLGSLLVAGGAVLDMVKAAAYVGCGYGIYEIGKMIIGGN